MWHHKDVSHFIALQRCCVFSNWRFVANVGVKQVYQHHFSNNICSLCVSVLHFVILTIFQTFKLLVYLLWWSVISNVWCYYYNCFEAPQTVLSSVQFSRSVVSNSLRPHESQHARPPCPSPTPGVHSDSRHRVSDTIQPSHPLLSLSPPAPNPSQHQSLFQWVNSSHEVAKVLEFQL